MMSRVGITCVCIFNGACSLFIKSRIINLFQFKKKKYPKEVFPAEKLNLLHFDFT